MFSNYDYFNKQFRINKYEVEDLYLKRANYDYSPYQTSSLNSTLRNPSQLSPPRAIARSEGHG